MQKEKKGTSSQTTRKMTFTHEHLLACARCNSPLLISKRDVSSSSPQSTAKTRLVLTYEQTVTGLLQGQTAIPSFLCDMPEDAADEQRNVVPSMTCIHVLNMEGFETPQMRHDFAIHCDLDAEILESHFVAISRLVGADVGACWTACHSGQPPHQEDAYDDDRVPLTLATIVEHGGQRDAREFADSQKKAISQGGETGKEKRCSLTEDKRWP